MNLHGLRESLVVIKQLMSELGEAEASNVLAFALQILFDCRSGVQGGSLK